MTDGVELNCSSVRICRWGAWAGGGVAAAIAAAGLLGRLSAFDANEEVSSVLPEMDIDTALGVLAVAGALGLALLEKESRFGQRLRWISRIIAGGGALIGLELMMRWLLGGASLRGIGQWMESGPGSASLPQEPSFLAALVLPVLGGSLILLIDQCSPKSVWWAQVMALGAVFLAFIPLTGYLYALSTQELPVFFAGTSVSTTVALLLLGLAVACARPGEGVLRLLNAGSAGGFVLRTLLLPVAVLPVLLTWLEAEGHQHGYLPGGFGWMLDAALTVLLGGLLVWSVARVAHQKDLARQAAEAELRRSEERYRQLVEMSPVAILVKDAKRIEFANPAAQRLVGAARAEEVLGRSPFAFLDSASRAQYEKEFCRVISEGASLARREQRIQRLDGREVEVEYSAAPVEYHGRRLAQVLVRDITESKKVERALQESERRFRLITETISEVFWIVDLKASRLTYISPAYERVSGRHCESLYERPDALIDAVHPDDRERVIGRLVPGNLVKPFEQEYRIVRPNGEVRWIWDRGFPVHDSEGKVTSFVGVAQDVTRYRRAQTKLEDTLNRLNLIARATNDVLWDWNVTTNHVWWGLGFGNPFGYVPSEISGGKVAWLDHIHPDDRPGIEAAMTALLASTDDTWLQEYRFRRHDGAYVDILDRAFVIRDSNGKPVRVVGAMLDVTAQKRAQATLRHQAEMLAQLDDAVVCTDAAGRVIYWNGAAVRLFGWTAEEAIGRVAGEARSDDAWARFPLGPLSQTASAERRITRKDGENVWVLARATPRRDEHDQPAGAIVVAHDITARKQAEAAQEERQVRVRRLIEDIFQLMPESLLVYSSEQEPLEQNRAFDRLVRANAARLGYSEAELRALLVKEVAASAVRARSGKIRILPKQPVSTPDQPDQGVPRQS